jgi:hypothetical protein
MVDNFDYRTSYDITTYPPISPQLHCARRGISTQAEEVVRYKPQFSPVDRNQKQGIEVATQVVIDDAV